MKLKFLKSLWGSDKYGDIHVNAKMIKEAGFDGIEAGLQWATPEEMKKIKADYDIIFNPMVGGANIEDFEGSVNKAVAYEPNEMISHSGRDYMNFDEGCRFFEKALQIEEKVGIPIAHETHRMRLLFTPWSTSEFLKKFPELKLNADFSNWAYMCPTFFDDMEHWTHEACDRSIHIHSRITDSRFNLQVSDPRAPEFEGLLKIFEGYWDRILETAEKRGQELFTINHEWSEAVQFNVIPYTQQPMVNVWDICVWQNQRFKERWAKYL